MTNEVRIRITAEDKASAVAEKAGASFEKLADRVTITGGVMVGAGAAALKLGNDFDGAMDTIAVGTGATGDRLDALNESFNNVFTTVPVSMAAASEAIAGLATRTGATGEVLEGMATKLLNLSRLTGTDVSNNVANITRVMGDWSISNENAGLAMDKLFLASQQTGIGIDELAQKVVQFGAPLRGMNFSFDESIAMLGKWEREGVNTELVLGSLRIAMGKFADANVPMRAGLEAVIREIQRLGPSAEATSLAMDVFGARAGPDMAAAILEGRFALGTMVQDLAKAEGAIDSTAKGTDDWREKLILLKNQVFATIAPHADLAAKILAVGGSVATMSAQMGKAIQAAGGLRTAVLNLGNAARVVATGFGVLTAAIGAAMLADKALRSTGYGSLNLNKQEFDKLNPAFQQSILEKAHGNSALYNELAVQGIVAGPINDLSEAVEQLSDQADGAAGSMEDLDAIMAKLNESLGRTEDVGEKAEKAAEKVLTFAEAIEDGVITMAEAVELHMTPAAAGAAEAADALARADYAQAEAAFNLEKTIAKVTQAFNSSRDAASRMVDMLARETLEKLKAAASAVFGAPTQEQARLQLQLAEIGNAQAGFAVSNESLVASQNEQIRYLQYEIQIRRDHLASISKDREYEKAGVEAEIKQREQSIESIQQAQKNLTAPMDALRDRVQAQLTLSLAQTAVDQAQFTAANNLLLTGVEQHNLALQLIIDQRDISTWIRQNTADYRDLHPEVAAVTRQMQALRQILESFSGLNLSALVGSTVRDLQARGGLA